VACGQMALVRSLVVAALVPSLLPTGNPGSWHGAGLTTAKGHMPYILFTLLDVLRAYPSQVRIYAYQVSTALLAVFEGVL
jgi:hypothetical protein